MRVLVIGGGGREHALCWKLRQSPLLEELYCAPGNPGIAEIADLVPRSVDEVLEIADFAASVRIDLAVVGPELPLALGIADELEMRGVPVFGPRQAAAEIEGSKVFAKEFMARHGIPTAAFEIAHDEASARAAARRFGFPVVLKADGLAAGKGVILPTDEAELEAALSLFFGERRVGGAADRVGGGGGRRSRSSRSPTARTCCRSPRLRITSGCATATSDRTPAGWARTARPASWARRAPPGCSSG